MKQACARQCLQPCKPSYRLDKDDDPGGGEAAPLPSRLKPASVQPIVSPLELYKALMSPKPDAKGVANREDGLNARQREAFEAGLTRNLALIQGPPGTSKTHVNKVRMLCCKFVSC